MNLGIDFGSTYSMLSYYDKINQMVKAVETEGRGRHIPSVACFKNSKTLVCGHTAKQTIAVRRTVKPYRAFKMLLPVDDPKELQKEGYCEEITPRRITKEFLKQQLQTARTKLNVKSFEKVTICVPHVWDKALSTLSGKAILKEICEEIIEEDGLMNSVRIVSEPAAATACFAHNYYRNTADLYEGWILVIDYGGGTLDITLSQVATIAREDGTKMMEITVRDESGAGEHHPDNRIGDAGIAYMQGVVAQALEDAGFHDAPRDAEFYQAADLLETSLIDSPQELIDKVSIDYFDNLELMTYDEDIFTEFDYAGELVPITYSTLIRVYDALIRPLLDKELRKIFNNKMRTELRMESPTDPVKNLKIALVGGFGQYILVQRQVCQFFGIGDDDADPRLHGLSCHLDGGMDSGKEDAISFGAALIADGIIALRKTAPYSIGLASRDPSTDRATFEFAFLANELLTPGDVYYLNHSILYFGADSDDTSPWQFVMNLDGRKDQARKLLPTRKVRERLDRISHNTLYYFGFSIDESEFIQFHVVPSINGKLDHSMATVQPLGNFADIFGSSVVLEKAPIIRKN